MALKDIFLSTIESQKSKFKDKLREAGLKLNLAVNANNASKISGKANYTANTKILEIIDQINSAIASGKYVATTECPQKFLPKVVQYFKKKKFVVIYGRTGLQFTIIITWVLTKRFVDDNLRGLSVEDKAKMVVKMLGDSIDNEFGIISEYCATKSKDKVVRDKAKRIYDEYRNSNDEKKKNSLRVQFSTINSERKEDTDEKIPIFPRQFKIENSKLDIVTLSKMYYAVKYNGKLINSTFTESNIKLITS